MIKKMLMMILLLGVISVSGCHTAQRTYVRAGYYDPYPYGYGMGYDPYARYYGSPYPAYFYDPYPYFFFGSDFFFFNPSLDNNQFHQPSRSLRGGGGTRGGGFNSGSAAPGAPAPSPSPAPGSRNLR